LIAHKTLPAPRPTEHSVAMVHRSPARAEEQESLESQPTPTHV
jgi:hypothetical protein